MTDPKTSGQIAGQIRRESKRRSKQPTRKQRTAALSAATAGSKVANQGEPTPELEARHTVAQRGSSGSPGAGKYVVDQRWIDRYHQRGQLNDRQHEAADRLYQLWMATGLNPRVIGEYVKSGGAPDGIEERQHQAFVRLRDTHRALGRHTWHVLEQVVIWDFPASRMRDYEADDPRSGVAVLKHCLAELADYWRI